MPPDSSHGSSSGRRAGSKSPTPSATAAATSEHSAGASQDQIVGVDSFTNRLITLHEISLQIDAARSRDAILGVLRTEMKWLLPGEVSLICLLDRFRIHYRIEVLSFPQGSFPLDGALSTVNEGSPGVVIQTHSPFASDLVASPGPPNSLERALQEAGMRSLLVVPLQGGDETIGALVLAGTAGQAFGVQDLAIARLLASQVANTLLNTAVFDDAQKRITQIELVNELAQKLTSTLELGQLLQTATETIRKAFNYTNVAIYLADHERRVARLCAHTGDLLLHTGEEYVQGFSEGIIGWVATHGERILANDVNEEPRYINPSRLKTRAELAIPIRVGRDVVGVLNVEDERAHVFDETDAIVLETLCDQLGSALRNAQLYDEIRRANEKLTELDRMKSDFLSIVSHDFRSPLSSIMLAARSLLKKEEPDGPAMVRQYLKVIVDQAERLIMLAEDTLSITRLESGKLNYMFNAVNLERLIQDAAGQTALPARHTLVFRIEQGLPPVRGDQAKLRQVVQNLLSNAVKYSPAGGPVEVGAARRTDDHLEVWVKDEGIGIPPEQMDRLFQKFTRIDTEASRTIRGTGLGLWICREILKAHGAEIWAESVVGKGSVFRFTLRTASAELHQGSPAS